MCQSEDENATPSIKHTLISSGAKLYMCAQRKPIDKYHVPVWADIAYNVEWIS